MRALKIGGELTWGRVPPSARETASRGRLWTSSLNGASQFLSVHRLDNMPLTVMVALAATEQMRAYEVRRHNVIVVAAGAGAALVLIVALICVWSWQITSTRERARKAEETYAAASKTSMDAFLVLRGMRDAGGVITDFMPDDVNKQTETLLSMSRAALIGKTLSSVFPELHSSGIFSQLVAVTTQGGVREGEWQSSTDPAAPRWLHRQVVAVENGVVAIVRDITGRKLSEERIRHLAHHDDLTGLANRLLVRDRLDHALLQAEQWRQSG